MTQAEFSTADWLRCSSQVFQGILKMSATKEESPSQKIGTGLAALLSVLGLLIAAVSIYVSYWLLGNVINFDAMSSKMKIAVWTGMAALLVGVLFAIIWVVSTVTDRVDIQRARKEIDAGDLEGAWNRLQFVACNAAGSREWVFQRCLEGLREIYSATGQDGASLDKVHLIHKEALNEPVEERSDDLSKQCRELIKALPAPNGSDPGNRG